MKKLALMFWIAAAVCLRSFADADLKTPSSTDVFGTGAFLLAGSEMYRLAQPAVSAK